MLFSFFFILACSQDPAPKARPALPQVDTAELTFHFGKIYDLMLFLKKAPKKGSPILVLDPVTGLKIALPVVKSVKAEDAFAVTLDLTELKLEGDKSREFSSRDLVAIYPAPAVAPALVKLSPETCPKMIHPSQVQACLDMDLDGKPDLLLANCCGKGYAFNEDKQVYCNDDLTSQCLWQWLGKSWKLVYKHDPC